MRKRAKALLLVLGISLAAPVLGGCGGGYYMLSANAATSRLEEARAMGAEQLAPYEYYYAKEHLRQAQIEAAEANYSDAINYAETAEEYANRAIQFAHEARRAGGR
jgi:hypothetical protein